MNERDVFDVMRRLNQVAREQVTTEDEARLDSIMSGPVVSLAQRRRRQRVVVAAAVVVAGVAGAAAWVTLRREPVTDPLTIACHATADARGDVTVVPYSEDPVQACSPLWTDGTFGTGEVPELTACTNDEGLAAVFPGDASVCQRLGLADHAAPDSVRAAGAVELQARLGAALGPTCLGEAEATAVATDLLRDLGLAGWTIEITQPFTPERPCAASGVDPERQVVSIGAIPPRRDLVPTAPAP